MSVPFFSIRRVCIYIYIYRERERERDRESENTYISIPLSTDLNLVHEKYENHIQKIFF